MAVDKKNLAILLLALLTVVNIAALVTFGYHRLGFERHFHPAGPSDEPRKAIRQELGLSQEQAEEFEARFEKFRAETKPITDSLEAKKMEMMNELSAARPSMERVDKLAGEIGALHEQLQKKMALNLLEGKSLLTPEQQEKFFSLFREGPGRAKGLRNPGAKGGPPGRPGFGENR
jgi:Spy/CpxP family protein refolding chaperone